MKSVLDYRNSIAIAEVSKWITEDKKGKVLSDNELSCLKKENIDAFAAWQLIIKVNNKDVQLTIAVDQCFPYSKPNFYISKDDHYLKYPHVESNGRLCLLPIHATFSHSRSIDVVQSLISDAHNLLIQSYSGANRDDFIDEFSSYWHRCINKENIQFLAYINPKPPSRKLNVLYNPEYCLFGDDIDKLYKWVKNRFGAENLGYFSEFMGYLFWLNKPLYPEQYPQNGNDLLNSAIYDEKDKQFILNQYITVQKELYGIIGFDTKNGPALGGIILRPPKKEKGKSEIKGFRNGHAPNKIIWDRNYANQHISLFDVNRIDAAWINTRSSSIYSGNLLEKSVCIIGCGSLGGEVTKILAKSGIGNLLLVDKDEISWGNIGRHTLGAKDIGKNKASAMMKYLQGQLPYLQIKYVDRDWQYIFRQDQNLFIGYDIIVSLTADWSSDDTLNTLCRKGITMPPIVFGWFEPYACAGHALAVMDTGGCLSCGMDECGHFIRRVFDWNGNTNAGLTRETACGIYYQPYGIVEASGTVNIVTELVIDILLRRIKKSLLRTWVGSLAYAEECGGKISAEWLKVHNNNINDKTVISEDWEINPTCKVCV